MKLNVVDCIYADNSCLTPRDLRVCCSNRDNTFRGLDRVPAKSCMSACKTRVPHPQDQKPQPRTVAVEQPKPSGGCVPCSRAKRGKK